MSTSDRTLSLLFLFTPEEPEWSVEEAAERLGVSISTAYRYFRSLAAAGLITSFVLGRYVLGPAITAFDRQMRLSDPLVNSAQGVMREMANGARYDGVVLLCRPYRNHVMCVHQEIKGQLAFASSYERGRPMSPLRGSMSKIILAYMPPRAVKAAFMAEKAEVERAGLGADWNEAKRTLRAIRTAGYCRTHAELDPGVVGVSVPLFDAARTITGSLGFVCSDQALGPERLSAMVEWLQTGSRAIEAELAARVGPAASPA